MWEEERLPPESGETIFLLDQVCVGRDDWRPKTVLVACLDLTDIQISDTRANVSNSPYGVFITIKLHVLTRVEALACG